jgi:hypothetical protein
MPDLSATYCFSLLKAKARSKDFNPEQYLPRECFHNNKVVLSYHLKNMLGKCNLELSHNEFVKLWQRFDLNNLDGVKTKVFLRLLGYRPNELNELATSIEAIRHKSHRVYSNKALNRSLQQNLNRDFTRSSLPRTSQDDFNDYGLDDDDDIQVSKPVESKPVKNKQVVAEVVEKVEEPPVVKAEEKVVEKKEEPDAEVTVVAAKIEPKPAQVDRKSAQEKRRKELRSASEHKFRDTSAASESKIKTMVRALKSARKFGPSQDLVSFLNAKLNEGYISFRTAFEYIDSDRLNHLLADEFKVVLEEFNVNMDAPTFQGFLRK